MLSVVADLYSRNSWEAYVNSVKLVVSRTKVDTIYPIIYLEVASITGKPFNRDKMVMWPNDHMSRNMTTYRYDEFDEKIIEQSGFQFKMAYSVRKLSKLNAIISFVQQTSTNLVLNPIERMLEKVKLIARNPLAAAQEDQI
jgi:hypothetical protein